MNHAIPCAAGAPPSTTPPRRWSLLLTSQNHGVVGAAGSEFKAVPEGYERVQVMEIVEAGTPPAAGTDLAGLVRLPLTNEQIAAGAIVRCDHGGSIGRNGAIEVWDAMMAAAPVAAQAGQVAVPEELSDAAIDKVWGEMPGGPEGWLKQFGYRQFARSIARHALVRVAASMAGLIRPSDDELWEQTIGERDHYHEMADKLAGAIAIHFSADIGEHSNMNCPWHEALDVIETASPAVAQQALAAEVPLWDDNGDPWNDAAVEVERQRAQASTAGERQKGGAS